ncbi:MAG: sigma-54-dependent Fis family transcriptional regulator [Desulfotalea sp.]
MKQPPTLLCIDDDAMLLNILQRYFELKGYRVLTAENGAIGLEMFRDHSPDLILVDLKMPIVDGFQVLAEVKATSSQTPIIVISGEGEMAEVIQALHLGAWSYMTKPVENYDILEHAVRQAFEKADLIHQNQAYQKGLESKLDTIIENFPGYVFTCSPDFIITYANNLLTENAGKDLCGQPCYNAIYGLDTVCDWCLGASCSSGKLLQQELQNPKDGRWYKKTCLPIFDQEKNIIEYQIVLLDITEEKQTLLDAQEREEMLQQENTILLASMTDRYKFGSIIGKSKPMQEVYKAILNAAGSEASVVISGESGTGKELVAQAIHDNSKRSNERFICVNCSAIPENLIESEFFGYKKGAFSGAVSEKHGFLDIADGGTLFLDEVGDIPLQLQVKLLRALEGGGFTPLGSTEEKKPNVRIVSATNKNLSELVKQGAMRRDFFYRIHVIPINLPPLRERKEDIILLIEHFLDIYDPERAKILHSQIRSLLQSYEWPGNIRELQNTIQRYLTMGTIDFIDISENDKKLDNSNSLTDMIEEFEKQIIIQQCERYDWHQGKTAEALQIDRKTLYRKLKHHDITKIK